MKRSPRHTRRQGLPARRKVRTKGVLAAPRKSEPADDATEVALSSPAASPSGLSDSEIKPSGAMIVSALMIGLGLLLLGVTAVSPARIPWPMISEPLYRQHSNLAVIGLGTIALALLLLNATVWL